VRGIAIRRDVTRSIFREENTPDTTNLLPAHLFAPGNARYRRVTQFNRAIGLTTNTEVILQHTFDRTQKTRLDFIGTETSNFGLFGCDNDVEYRLSLDGTLVPGFERWMGLTNPLRDKTRQQFVLALPAGGTLILFARLPSPLVGGIGDTFNSFDVRAEFGFWYLPS